MNKIRFIISVAQAILLLSGLANSLLAESPSATKLKLQKAYFAERSEGDLDKAIGIYQEIITQNEIDKQYVAQAAYQLGCCFEKKGEYTVAVQYYRKVVSEYPGVTDWYSKAKMKLDKLNASVSSVSQNIFEDGVPPQSLMPYLMGESFSAFLDSMRYGIQTNIIINLVDSDFKLQIGGFIATDNSSEKGTEKYILSYFEPKRPNMQVYDKFNEKMDIAWVDSGSGANLFWDAGRKLEDGEIHYFYYTYGELYDLPSEGNMASLTMQNYFGSEVNELYFLVLPDNLRATDASRDYTSKKSIDGFDVYLWKKRNPKNTNNIVNVKINSVINVNEIDKLESEDLAGQGWELWRQRKLPEAEEIFKKAVKLNPDNENGWQGLGWSQLNQGKRAAAKVSFEKCVELNPKNSAALNGLGWIADGTGNKEEAIEWWEKAVEAQPGATASLNGLVKEYMERKDYKNAEKYLMMWQKVDPGNDEVKNQLKKAREGL